jgi:glycosyltransferase involved in cell wall biosynthesis
MLMGSQYDWAGPLTLGSHHLARGFAEAGWDVARISAPLSPVQVLRDINELRARVGRYSVHGHEYLDGHLWTYFPAALLAPYNRPILRSRLVFRHWQRLTIPNVVHTVQARGFGDVDLLFIDAPTQAFWLDEIDHRASVTRVMDLHAGFSSVAPELLALERDVIRRTGLTVYTAASLESHVRGMGARHVLHLPNGVDFDHFATGSRARPADLGGIARPIVIYIGEIAEWFDFDTIDALATALPNVSFVLIGPDRLARTRVTPRSNVHVLGPRPFGSLPGYLNNADVGIIPFDVVREPAYVHPVHPLKLYEYLACGLPVVATRWDELERLDSPATLCESPDDFVQAIQRALQGDHDVEAGIRFSQAADWKRRVTTLIEAVDAVTLTSP